MKKFLCATIMVIVVLAIFIGAFFLIRSAAIRPDANAHIIMALVQKETSGENMAMENDIPSTTLDEFSIEETTTIPIITLTLKEQEPIIMPPSPLDIKNNAR